MFVFRFTCLIAESSVETALWLVERRFVTVRPMYLAPGFHFEGLVEPVVHRDILEMKREREKAFRVRKEKIWLCDLAWRTLTGEEIKCHFILCT